MSASDDSYTLGSSTGTYTNHSLYRPGPFISLCCSPSVEGEGGVAGVLIPPVPRGQGVGS